MELLSKAERAALAIIVNSGRAAVEVEMLSTEADDGRRVVTGHGGRSRETGQFVGRVGIGAGDVLDGQTAERLRSRGLVELWHVGVVKVVNHDTRRKGVRPALMATLTPFAAKLLGVKLAGGGGILRWSEAGGGDEPAEVIDDPARPYPSPLPELESLPAKRAGRKRSRPASP